WQPAQDEWQAAHAHWRRGHSAPPWEAHGRMWSPHGWHPTRRFFFIRFVAVLAVIVLLVSGALALLYQLLASLSGEQNSVPLLILIRVCGLALALPILAMAIGARVFRSYAIPLADIM